VKEFIRCELCNVEICEPQRCTFAVIKRTIGGKEYYFCCETHAREFEKKKKKK